MTIEHGVAGPLAPREPDLIDRQREQIDAEVGVGEQRSHADEIVKHVGEGALPRAQPCREVGPVRPARRISRRLTITGLTTRTR